LDVDWRNSISNMSYTWLSLGSALLLIISIGVIYAAHPMDSVQNNSTAYSWLNAYGTAAWVLLALPWQFMEQRRPGQALPPGTNYFTVGIKNAWLATKEIRKLKQTLLYFASFFIIWDAVNTYVLLTGILQNEVISYDVTTYNYLTIVTYVSEGFGIWFFWYLQQRLHWPTKNLLYIMCFVLIGFNIWGVVGIWTNKIGFHHEWEFWLFNALCGVGSASWYQLGYTMIGDVVPVTKTFLFFSLFGISGKASGFVGPFAVAAMIDDAGGNTNVGFAFVLGSALLGLALLYFVDVEKSKVECKKYIEDEARDLYKMSQKQAFATPDKEHEA